MIPILFIIPKPSIALLIILISSTLLLTTVLFFLIRKRVDSVKKIIVDLSAYFLFISAIIFAIYKFGPFPVKTYGVLVAFGFLGAILVARKLAERSGINPDVVVDLFVYIFIGTLIGMRSFYVLFYDLNTFLSNPLTLFIFWKGGLVFYGGLVGGIGGGLLFVKRKKLSPYKLADACAVGLPVGLFFGRLGCLGFGCCYGKTMPNSILSIRFPAIGHKSLSFFTPAFRDHLNQGLVKAHEHFSLPVFPAQIASSLLNGVVLFFILLFLFNRKKYDGQIGGWFLILYAINRFIIEFLRVEPNWLGLNVSQWIGFLILSSGLFVLHLAKKDHINQLK